MSAGESAVRDLESGNFRGVLDPAVSVVPELGATGFPKLAELVALVANGLWAMARGDVVVARYTYGQAVLLLPPQHRHPDRRDGIPVAAPPACSTPGHDGGPADEVVARIARVLWREQCEIAHLHRRSQGIEPVQALVEAVVQEVSWTIFDGYYLRAVQERRHTLLPVPPPRQCAGLCDRATRIVRLDRPQAERVSRKVWRTAGSYDGLFAEVVAELAAARSPAPWQNARGARCVPVRTGRLRLWEHAQRARADRNP